MTSNKVGLVPKTTPLPVNILWALFVKSYLATARQRQIGERRQVGTAVCVHYDYFWSGKRLTADNFFLTSSNNLTADLAAIKAYKPAPENQIFIPHTNPAIPEIMEQHGWEDRGQNYMMERPLTEADQDLTPAVPVQHMNSPQELKHFNGIFGGSVAIRADVMDDRFHFYYLMVGETPVAQARSWHAQPTISWESHVNTDPNYQRRGYGTAIMTQLIKDNANAGIKTSVLVATEAGSRLYQRVGYTNRLTIGCYKWKTKDSYD